MLLMINSDDSNIKSLATEKIYAHDGDDENGDSYSSDNQACPR